MSLLAKSGESNQDWEEPLQKAFSSITVEFNFLFLAQDLEKPETFISNDFAFSLGLWLVPHDWLLTLHTILRQYRKSAAPPWCLVNTQCLSLPGTLSQLLSQKQDVTGVKVLSSPAHYYPSQSLNVYNISVICNCKTCTCGTLNHRDVDLFTQHKDMTFIFLFTSYPWVRLYAATMSISIFMPMTHSFICL